MSDFAEYIVTCNGAPLKKGKSDAHYLELEYRGEANKNVNIELNNFVTKLYKLKKERYKDLLEIAGYIFAADRKTSRGDKDAVEYHGWSRLFDFHIKVRDYNFWNNPEVKKLLSEALCFMTGDQSYQFNFYQAEEDFPTNIFDNENFELDPKKNLSVVLFSGGLDSLAGVIEKLETTEDEICLVSHQSGQPGVVKTQNQLYKAIESNYPGRCKHYKFHCGLSHTKSIDETQRTRAFLYASTAFAIANTYKQNSIYVYENGITTINFAKTQDLMNGRASRTTHPKTLGLLEKLFTKIAEEPFKIEHSFFFKTKTDIIENIKKYKKLNLMNSAVTCSRTRNHPAEFTHCGICSQCIDRIFAAYASEAETFDEGVYHFKFFKDLIEDEMIRKALIDYIRLADEFSKSNSDYFYVQRASELIDVIEYIEGKSDEERVEKIFNLCQKHSKQIELSIQRLSELYDKPFAPANPKSFFSLIVGTRAYQKIESGAEVRKEEIAPEQVLKEIPSRGLKKLAIETCNKLISDKVIKEVLVETKKDKCISSLIAAELRKGYILTKAKENSISDYFRKFYLQIKQKEGVLTVIDSYKVKV